MPVKLKPKSNKSNIESSVAKLSDRGFDEILLRVCKVDSKLEPVSWQCIIKQVDRTTAWVCTVRDTALDALKDALKQTETQEDGSKNATRVLSRDSNAGVSRVKRRVRGKTRT